MPRSSSVNSVPESITLRAWASTRGSWKVPASNRLILALQCVLSDPVRGSVYELSVGTNISLFYDARRFLGMTNSGCFAANQEVFLPASLRKRFNSSWSAQTIKCLPDGERR